MSLQAMYDKYSVSPWLDDLSRDMCAKGKLYGYVSEGIRGLTSNPTIFAKAISDGDVYTADIHKLARDRLSVEEIYWHLVLEDIRSAADILRPVYESSNGTDGYVSLEVSPKLANDRIATVKQARELWHRVRRANLMIKVPATEAGLGAITTLTREGINVNVTLIFSLSRYLEVVNAYLSGLEKREGGLRHIHSVASFFVSRIDTAVDSQLPKRSPLAGKTATSQAQAAYGLFLEAFNPLSERWSKLIRRGANVQRPLWASTSVKNPSYDPLLYVKNLLLPSTVNTMPASTIAQVSAAKTSDFQELGKDTVLHAHETLSAVEASGISLRQITQDLESEGVKKFILSYEEVLESIEKRLNS